MVKKFKQVAISTHDETLKIDAVHVTYIDIHYDVIVTGPDENGHYVVTGEQPKLSINLGDENIDVNELTTDSVRMYKPFFGKHRLIPLNGIVEYKERTKRTYTSNKILIIE